MYVPILKAKQGEKDALLQLKQTTKQSVRPLLEIPPEHIADHTKLKIKNFWDNKIYYLDFAFETVSEGISNETFDKWFLNRDFNYMIPVLHLSYEISRIKNIFSKAKQGIAIRIALDEFFEEDFESDFNQIIQIIEPKQTDIIIDAQAINESDYKKQAASVTYCLEQIDDLNLFRNIIVCSGSFPNSLDIEKEQFLTIPKLELDLFNLVNKKIEFPLTYGDYGINHWAIFEFILGMQVSFNIRYTLYKSYLVYKGTTAKKGGFSYENIKKACQTLVNSSEYFGKEHSWGDLIISDIADGTKGTGGNSTTWRSIGTNHHIETIVKQLSNPGDF
ncbi:TPA: hypothetical protein QFK61_002064 [Enterococcus faecium]|nr:hypothetical protein [Enterococcus faecium]NTM32979.1 hypothetical protein [Enterococcus faecium]